MNSRKKNNVPLVLILEWENGIVWLVAMSDVVTQWRLLGVGKGTAKRRATTDKTMELTTKVNFGPIGEDTSPNWDILWWWTSTHRSHTHTHTHTHTRHTTSTLINHVLGILFVPYRRTPSTQHTGTLSYSPQSSHIDRNCHFQVGL